MQSDTDIPVLTDLIELGNEITMTDLGFDEDMQIIEPPPLDEDSTEPNLGFYDEPAAADAANPVSHNTAVPPVSYASTAATAGNNRAAEPANPASAQRETATGADIFADNPALEQRIRQILDDHMEQALLEIKQTIRKHSKSD